MSRPASLHDESVSATSSAWLHSSGDTLPARVQKARIKSVCRKGLYRAPSAPLSTRLLICTLRSDNLHIALQTGGIQFQEVPITPERGYANSCRLFLK
jgi:hypothetical protein